MKKALREKETSQEAIWQPRAKRPLADGNLNGPAKAMAHALGRWACIRKATASAKGDVVTMTLGVGPDPEDLEQLRLLCRALDICLELIQLGLDIGWKVVAELCAEDECPAPPVTDEMAELGGAR